MTRRFPAAAIAPLAFLFIRCADPGSTDPVEDTLQPVPGMTISDPQSVSSNGSAGRFALAVADQSVVYISVSPNTLSETEKVQIENRTRKLPPSLVTVVNGGFDPVAIEAGAGDTLDVTGWRKDGTRDPMVVKVPAKKPPTVVRSNPPRGRTDVALNVIVTVVFSEPVNKSTVTASSLLLLRDGQNVSGRVAFESESWAVDFIPDEPLAPNANYEIVVRRDVEDESGDQLDAAFNASFTAGTDPCLGAAAPPNCVPTTAGTNAITGIVRQRAANGVMQPISNAVVSAWLNSASGTGYSIGETTTDAAGRYNLGLVPDGTVQLYANVPGLNQPCGASAKLTGDGASVDIELVGSANSSVETASALPRIFGIVYELVPLPDDRFTVAPQGVASPRIYLESPAGFVAVTTNGDAAGHYALCNLPLGPAALYAVKSGFDLHQEIFMVTANNLAHDVEMQRAR